MKAARHFVTAVVTAWVTRRQQAAIDYIIEENRILKEKLGKRRRNFGPHCPSSSVISHSPRRWSVRQDGRLSHDDVRLRPQQTFLGAASRTG